MSNKYSYEIIKLRPLAYWRLGEPSGTAAADVLSRYPGVYTTSPTLGETGALVGDSDTSVLLGTGAYVTMGDVLSFDYDAPFTITGFFKTSNTGLQSVVSKIENSGNQRGWDVYLDASNHYLNFALSSVVTTDDLVVQVQTAYNDGNWHNFVITYDGTYAASGVHIYVDGIEQTVSTVRDGLDSTETTVSTASLNIGAVNDTGQKFTGHIDEIAIFGYELTKEEALLLYYTGQNYTAYEAACLAADPEIFLRLNEVSGAVAYDTSRHGVNGVVNGTPTRGVPGVLPREQAFGIQLNKANMADSISFNDLWGGGSQFVDGQTMTLNLWFNTTDTDIGGSTLFSANYADDANYLVVYLNRTTAGFISIQTMSDAVLDVYVGWTNYSAASVVVAGIPMMLSLVMTSATTMDIYINGRYKQTHTHTTIPWSVVTKYALGQEWIPTATGTWWFDGVIGEFFITKRVMTELELRRIRTLGMRLASDTNYHLSTLCNLDAKGLWRLSEPSGYNYVEDSIGGVHGYQSSVTVYQEEGAIPNESDNLSYYFGSSDFTYFGLDSQYDYNQPFSFAFWFKGTSTGVNKIIICNRSNSNPYRGYEISLNTANEWAFVLCNYNSTADLIVNFTNADALDGNWHHYVFTYSGVTEYSGMRCFADGVELAGTGLRDTLTTQTTITTVGRFQISGRYSGSYYAYGWVDEVAEFDYALTPSQARRMYFAAQAEAIYSALVKSHEPMAYWRLGDASGTVTDEMGSYDGTAVNSPTYGAAQLTEVGADDAMSFTRASTQHIDISATAVISGETDFVINAWIKPTDALTNGHRIYQESSAANDACALYINSSGLPEFLIRYSGVDYTATADSIDIDFATDRVYMITGRLDSTGGMSIFVNGRLAGTDANTNPTDETVNDVDLAARVLATAVYMEGTLDEVALIPYSVSDEEIEELYLAGFNVFYNDTNAILLEQHTSTATGSTVEQDHLHATVYSMFTLLDAHGLLEYVTTEFDVSTVLSRLIRHYEAVTTGTNYTTSITAEQIIIVVEAVLAGTVTVDQIIAINNLSDRITIEDLMYATWQLSAAESISTTAVAADIAKKVQIISTVLATAGVAVPTSVLNNIIIDSLIIQALHEWTFDVALTESMDITGLAVGLHRAIVTLIESAAHTDSTVDTGRLNVLTVDNFDIDDLLTFNQRLVGDFTDSMAVGGTLLLDGELYSAVVLNATTLAPSEYSNFPFNSFGRMGSTYLGATDSAIYALSGDDDDGTQIDAIIRSGLENFGNSQYKRVPRAYLGYTSTGALILKTISTGGSADGTARGTKVERWYELTPRTADAPATARIKLGRGVKATYWQFELTNKDGADFDIDELKLLPVLLSRRV